MTTGDMVFPIPGPAFLFVHTLMVRNVLTTSLTGRGKTTTTYQPELAMRGYLTAPDPNNEDSAGTERIRFAAVALFANGSEVYESSLIRCDDLQVPPALRGTYKVDVIRPNLALTRCMLVRYTGPWELAEE